MLQLIKLNNCLVEENGFTRIKECYSWVGSVSGNAVNGKKKTLSNNTRLI